MPGSHETVSSGLTCCATQAAARNRLAAAADSDADPDADADADPVRPVSRFPVSAMIGAVAATHTSSAAAPK
jgi:hypothetical protein